MLIKTVLDYSLKFFEFNVVNVTGLPPKKWTVLHTKFYIEYKYSDHTQKIFISFGLTVLF